MLLSDLDRLDGLAQRFIEKIDFEIEAPCWTWTGGTDRSGYGQIKAWVRGVKKQLPAHRLAFLFHNGYVSDELWVLHKCDNRRCVNPEHFFEGTAQDNTADKMAKGRGADFSGENNSQAVLNWMIVKMIREDRDNGMLPAAIYARYPQYHRYTIRNVIFNKRWISRD